MLPIYDPVAARSKRLKADWKLSDFKFLNSDIILQSSKITPI
jgi:hypothetical protein